MISGRAGTDLAFKDSDSELRIGFLEIGCCCSLDLSRHTPSLLENPSRGSQAPLEPLMDKIVIRGGQPLNGIVPIAGAKNAALPILMATLVAPGRHRLTNVPELVDVSTTLSLLGRLGCPSLVSPGSVQLDTTRISFNEAPYELVRRMRASVLALGPLLGRCGEAKVSLPGGCAIGMRPIDQHLKGMEALGATFELKDGYVHGRADRLIGNRVVLDVPTVTGTENILMAAVLAEGESLIENAAREPEIVDLANFLNSLGARIEDAIPAATI